MPSINKVILIGNLGRDPEVKYMSSGKAVCNLSIATTRSWKNREGGERQEETEWHRVVLYERLAEIVCEYLENGKPVYIEGRLKTRKWQDKEGRDMYTTEIIAEQMQLLGGRDEGMKQEKEKPAPRRHSDRPGGATNRPRAGNAGRAADDFDDDIPY